MEGQESARAILPAFFFILSGYAVVFPGCWRVSMGRVDAFLGIFLRACARSDERGFRVGFHHVSILVSEVVEALAPWRGGLYVDGTVGGGGHAEAVLEAGAEAGARLLGLDRDPEALAASAARLARFGDRVTLVRANYRALAQVLAERALGPVSGLLVDAGVSSHQLDTPGRGFSFQHDGPLDMRMGDEGETAGELLDRVDGAALATILGRYGEIKGARRAAERILEARRAGRLETTSQLADLMGPRRARDRIHPATQVFQALRIAVNDELGGLEALVEGLGEVLAPGGRAAFISFHSLEDRIVKHGLRKLADPCVCPPGLPMCACGARPVVRLVGGLVRPGDEETEVNPRARSARLRVAERL